jgi:DNA-nicking Smr family endonuclease
MAKKRKHAGVKASPPKAASPKEGFASPFKDLKKMLAEAAKTASVAAPRAATASRQVARSLPQAARNLPVAPVIDEPDDDETILRRALEGVRPLNGNTRARMPIEPPTTHTIVNEDAEVIAQLSDLVSGQLPFDITESDEYVEGYRVGLDPRLVSELRRGKFAVQDHFDMHGLIQGAAKEALKEFIIASVRKGLRTVLVVHGRGLRSPGGHSILKHASAGWLSHGAIGGHVLAFTTARAADGGAGATYVLLKREKSRSPFDILQGAKRRE